MGTTDAFTVMFKQKNIILKEVFHVLKSYQEIPIRFLEIDPEKSLRVFSACLIHAHDLLFIVRLKI